MWDIDRVRWLKKYHGLSDTDLGTPEIPAMKGPEKGKCPLWRKDKRHKRERFPLRIKRNCFKGFGEVRG